MTNSEVLLACCIIVANKGDLELEAMVRAKAVEIMSRMAAKDAAIMRMMQAGATHPIPMQSSNLPPIKAKKYRLVKTSTNNYMIFWG
jgi:hypothetical protein